MSNIDLSSAIKNITIQQGSTVEVPFQALRNLAPIDLTNYLVRLQVRRFIGDSTVLINATQANSKLIWTDHLTGQFKLSLVPADTSSAGNGKIRFSNDEDVLDCVYDLELESPIGVVFPLCRGAFNINREVTR